MVQGTRFALRTEQTGRFSFEGKKIASLLQMEKGGLEEGDTAGDGEGKTHPLLHKEKKKRAQHNVCKTVQRLLPGVVITY